MDKKRKIFILEDDVNILNSNMKILEWEGFEVYGAASLSQARELIKTCTPDAFVLDVNLPDGSGMDFCREIRPFFKGPVLFLTALNEKSDILKGLRSGGNEYITKPFDVDEFIARLEALLELSEINRDDNNEAAHVESGCLKLDIKSLRAYINREDINLTPREFSVLLYLYNNAGRKIPPERLFGEVWMEEVAFDATALPSDPSQVGGLL